MIATQTLESFPPFGDNATKVKPDDAKYAAGFQAADVLPAEWMNWTWGKSSKGITDLNAGVEMMEAEINNVLAGATKTPDPTKDNQLLESIQKLISDAKAEAILAAHPVGSLYWSSTNTDPGTLFGGTWQRIKDKFILAAGDTYTNGATGGAATVTLTTNNMPSHTHSIGGSTGETQPTFTGTEVTSKAGSAHNHGLNSHTHTLSGTFTTKNTINTGNTNAKTMTGSFDLRHISYGPTANPAGIVSTANSTYGGNYATVVNDSALFTKISFDVAHRHQIDLSGNTGQASGNTANESAHTHKVTASGTVQKHSHTLPANTGSSGSGTAVDKMPPYLVKYCWERTA